MLTSGEMRVSSDTFLPRKEVTTDNASDKYCTQWANEDTRELSEEVDGVYEV